MSTVAVTQNDNITAAIHQALDRLDLEPLIHNKTVAVKPNDTWASADDVTAVTQPETLQAVLRYVKKFHPKRLIVSGGSGAGETDEIMKLTGMMKVIESEQAIFFDHNRPPFQEVALEYAPDKDVQGPQRSVMINPRILEYETLISLAQLKVHETATVTLSLKNIAMSYPAADYYGHPRGIEQRKHHFFEDMHSFIAAMAKRFPIQASIIVGQPAMIGMGPIGGHTFNSGMVVASIDPLAADVVGARLLGFSYRGVHHLWEAWKLGVGEVKIDKMQFPAMDIDEAFGAFTKAAYGKSLSLSHA